MLLGIRYCLILSEGQMAQLCGIIPPRRRDIIGHRDDYLGECILPNAHNHVDCHLLKTPEGVYTTWQYDYDCDCCGPEEDERCTIYSNVSKEEAEVMLNKRRE